MINFFEYNLAESLHDVETVIRERKPITPVVVSCLNPHSFVMALDDDAFRLSLVDSDILLPDGEGVCWAVKKKNGRRIKKIAGDDLHGFLIGKAEQTEPSTLPNGRIYYMGSNDEVLEKIERRIHDEHPSIDIKTYSPPFCDELSDDESMKIVDDINTFAPDVVFVGMGAPKQEKWTQRWSSKMEGVKVIANIGAVFEFYSNTHKRAPKWMVSLKLEWLVRLVKEPKRMWRRVFVSTPKFVRHVYKQ